MQEQGHNEQECWIIHPELHKKFEEVVEDQGKGKEVVGTTTNSTKVLSSGKALGKPISNPTRQE